MKRSKTPHAFKRGRALSREKQCDVGEKRLNVSGGGELRETGKGTKRNPRHLWGVPWATTPNNEGKRGGIRQRKPIAAWKNWKGRARSAREGVASQGHLKCD